jgi:Protein UNC80
MLEILPITDWSQTAVRPALNLILRRLERMFGKIYKKSILRVSAQIFSVCIITVLSCFTVATVGKSIASFGPPWLFAAELSSAFVSFLAV